MFCKNCGNQLKDGAKFCAKCGKKIEIAVSEQPEEPQGTDQLEPKEADTPQAADLQEKDGAVPIFCNKCGNRLKPGAKFCAKCGSPVIGSSAAKAGNNAPETENDIFVSGGNAAPETNREKTPSSGNKALLITIICSVILIIALIVGLVALLGGGKKDKSSQKDKHNTVEEEADQEKKSETTAETTQLGETTAAEASTEAADAAQQLATANFNLSQTDTVTLTGQIKQTSKGWTLNWKDNLTFGEQGAAGTPVVVTKTYVYIDEEFLPEGILGEIKSDEEVTVVGTAYIQDDSVFVMPDTITDQKGVERIAAYERLDGDYIIPYSDSVLLTDDDVKDLTLQEINYAKNEIYARHGRRFDSQELQDYFNSKSWYHGTVDAKDFDGGSYLSDIENKNAAFLSSVENKLGPYKLDSR